MPPTPAPATDQPTDAAPRRRAVFHPLTVAAVRPLTAEAVEVVFDVPEELADSFAYRAGQHVAVRARIDGAELRRSYSICRAPSPGRLTVAIKREQGGAFSTWAVSELQAGDVLEVMSPDGHFVPHGVYDRPARFAAIAAGSGITPMVALIEHQLRERPDDTFDLVYSNRTAGDAMFVDELADLKDRFPARLALHHVLTRETRPAELLSGRLDDERLETLLTRVIGVDGVDEWFLCGPIELVERARSVLRRLGVDPASIRVELFSTGRPAGEAPRIAPPETRAGEPVRTIAFRLDGTTGTVTTPVSARETILAAALRTRGDVPFACADGVCGTCRAVLRRGTAEMAQNHALEPEELARGLILTCQAVPTSDTVEVDWDA
ncbi:1,2-phenylacetyl-CoA epoxidase subunit PaaE [Microbacterium aureliae]